MILTKNLQDKIRAEMKDKHGTVQEYCKQNDINYSWLSGNVFSDKHLDNTPPARIREIIRELGLA